MILFSSFGFSVAFTLTFTFLTHSKYLRQGTKWWWEPEVLAKGMPAGRARTDPNSFSRCFSPRHKGPLLAPRTPFPSKNGPQSEVCPFVSPITARVKKKCLAKYPTVHKKVLYGVVVGVPIVGVIWANV